MPYSAEISRSNPTCFLFLIDRSGSMSDAIGGEVRQKKADVVADAINRLLQALILRCAKSEGVRDYFHVGVIGYGSQVGPALGGPLTGRGVVPISEVANNPLRVEQRIKKVSDGAGGLVDQEIQFPLWFEAEASGGTPMCQALDLARQTVSEFLGRYPRCFPPMVLNLTDGESGDGSPESAAEAIRHLTSSDGNVLLFNLHISSASAAPVQFPDSEGGLPDQYAKQLFRMSSVLPPSAQDTARGQGFQITAGSRGFVFNADLVSVIQFLEIGTRVDRNLR